MKQLGRETISASVFDLDDLDALKVERDENDQRKEPTISDKVALAEAIAKRLAGPGRPRNGEDISTFLEDAGKKRDIATTKAVARFRENVGGRAEGRRARHPRAGGSDGPHANAPGRCRSRARGPGYA